MDPNYRLTDLSQSEITPAINYRIREACISDSVETFHELQKSGLLPDLAASLQILPTDWLAQDYATANNSQAVLEWLRTESGFAIDFGANSNRTLAVAMINGHTDLMMWLYDNNRTPINLSDNHHSLFQAASSLGNLEALQWIIERSVPAVDVQALQTSIFEAARCGQLKIVQWLAQSGYVADLSYNNCFIVQAAAQGGQLDVLKWLLLDSGQPLTITRNQNKVLRRLAHAREFRILEWVLQDCNQLEALLNCKADDFSWIKMLPALLQQTFYQAQTVNAFLEKNGVSLGNRAPFLLDKTCYHAILSGVASDCRTLINLKDRAESHRSRQTGL